MISQESLDFYQKNKNCTWQLESPPNLSNDHEFCDWFLNQSNFGWLELDLEIDLDRWTIEAMQAQSYYVAHREDDNIGWNSCCIHGIDIDKTGAWTNYGYDQESNVPYDWTALSEKTPIIKKFWTETFPSDHYRRIRFMQLQANSAITPHSDMPGKLPGEDNFNALEFGIPINIAVIHPGECHMVLEDFGVVPFKPGRAFIVNIRHKHSVVNFSAQDRIHVIGHSFGYGSKIKDFSKLVTRSYYKQYGNL